ncbi:MAG TPA: DUF815 domain-containing protein, partial [Caulobacteraceae bacterium]
MDEEREPALERIAAALERLAPPALAPAAFAHARLFRHDPKARAFIPAPDYGLALDLLVGVERQKALVVEAFTRFAAALPVNHVLLWGVRGAGKSSLVKAAFMAVAGDTLKLVEVDRDEVAALPELFETLRERA